MLMPVIPGSLGERKKLSVDASFAWIVWVALILVFVIVETVTVELVFAMLAVGCAGGLVSGLLLLPTWGQVLVAAGLSVVLLTVLRPRLLRRLGRGGDPAKSNIDALIGMQATVVSPVSTVSGQIKLAIGEVWSARLVSATGNAPIREKQTLQPGARVSVVGIDGATAVVRLLDSPQSAETDPERNEQ